jgi:hypothetical protein
VSQSSRRRTPTEWRCVLIDRLPVDCPLCLLPMDAGEVVVIRHRQQPIHEHCPARWTPTVLPGERTGPVEQRALPMLHVVPSGPDSASAASSRR